MEFELLAQFLFGVGGALVLVYLRIFEALPRMTGTKEIKLREIEIEGLREKWHEIAKKSEISKDSAYDKLRGDYQSRERELRNEIRSLKLRQWALAASLYILLGGIFSMVVFPLISEGKIISDGAIQSIEAVKCMGIGFTWTTYISLLTGKTSEKEINEIQAKALDDVKKKSAEVATVYEKKIGELTTQIDNYKKKSEEVINTYKELLGIKK